MDWLNESMFIDEDEKIAKRKARMYYHYRSSSDIGTIFKDGRVISGFTLKNITSSEIKSEKIMIAFGNSRRSGMISMMGMKRVNKGNYVARGGLMYVECELDPDELWILEESVTEVESIIENYCLLLPLVKKDRGTTTKYAVIFDDWDVGDEYFGKGMPKNVRSVLRPMCYRYMHGLMYHLFYVFFSLSKAAPIVLLVVIMIKMLYSALSIT